MKAFFLIFASLLAAKSCSGEAIADVKNAKMEYTANNRGFFEKIVLQNQQMTVSFDRNAPDKGVSTHLSEADWKQIAEAFSKVEWVKLPEFKDPTQRRFYDGAAIADLKVTYKGKEYQSKPFDHKSPPLEIAQVVNKLVELAGTRDKE